MMDERRGFPARRLPLLWTGALMLGSQLFFNGAAAGTPSCAAVPAGYTTLQHKDYTLHFRPTPAPITVGTPFALEVLACPKDASRPVLDVAVDATMPAHGHGMLYRASVSKLSTHAWSAKGLLFHMHGSWRFSFVVRTPSGVDTLVHDANVR
ncbi:MAG: hypothetical protein Q8R72_06110 [Hylemonella sp.]|nr:hypothetical protein [Hylemonella sp.]